MQTGTTKRERSIWDGKILARCCIWDWNDSQRIAILNSKGRKKIVLNKWETFVFHEANGNNTVDDIIKLFPTLYRDKHSIPEQYKENIMIAIENLILTTKLIELWEVKDDLPYKFELPQKEQAV